MALAEAEVCGPQGMHGIHVLAQPCAAERLHGVEEKAVQLQTCHCIYMTLRRGV